MGRRSRSRSPKERKHSSRRRSRSRSPSRRRHRSRSRERRSGPDPNEAAQQAQQAALAALQQQQLQKQLLAQQQLLQQQAAASSGATAQANKKQREVYVGNLTIGVVTDVMLRDLFNGCLAHLSPIDASGTMPPIGADWQTHPNPPVVTVRLDSTGRFGFVEMRTEELSHQAMLLDKVELCGRSINVGRPKGYVRSHLSYLTCINFGLPPPLVDNGAPEAAISAAQAAATALAAQQPTPILRLDNMVKAHQLLEPQERADLIADLKAEAGKHGKVEGIAAPPPPPQIGATVPARVYIRFSETSEAEAAREVFDGRTFDDNKIATRYVNHEYWLQAQAGVWEPQQLNMNIPAALPPPPAQQPPQQALLPQQPQYSAAAPPGQEQQQFQQQQYMQQPLPGPPPMPAGAPAPWG